MYLNKKTNASYNFKAPEIDSDANMKVEIFFPSAEALSVTPSSNAATVIAERDTTIIDLGSVSDDTNLTLTPGENLNVGSKAIVKIANSAAASKNLTVNTDTSTTVGTIAVAASATVVKEIVWTGSAWIIVG